ncbi:MAG: cation-translocating P-type ATPase [Anaerolineae bacterium]|nr:cation-translocating P-type ATPase [Anaerolineae bacterium]
MVNFYQLDTTESLKQLQSDPHQGLSASVAQQRLTEYGRNELPRGERHQLLKLIISQFKNIMVIILILAALISALVGDPKDVIVILVIVVLNAALGTYQEYRAEQALAALSAMQVPQVRVRRDGEVRQVSAEQLVPGDLVLLQEGDRIPADGRLILIKNLQIEEAALTGESHPVEKTLPAIDREVGIGDRKNMAFMGTSVNYGRGEMVVTATGLKTELGKIATLLMNVEDAKTPLQVQLDRLSWILVQGAVVIVIVVFIAGLLRGLALSEMLITAISLAVAAVPEGLPAIITVSLSLGAGRMVRRAALIRRLPAVETLGSVTVICSDKTGTLTKNEMTATTLALPGLDDVSITGIGYQPDGRFVSHGQDLDPRRDSSLGRFLRAMALSTDAYLERDPNTGAYQVVGDTTEGALLVAAQKVGWTREELEQDLPRVAELPFSSERKAMTTIHQVRDQESIDLFDGATLIALTKGAPDKLIGWASCEQTPDGARPLSEERRQLWQTQVDQMAARGLRVLGVAYRPLTQVPDPVTPEIERELHLLGLIGILDPARPEAKAAVTTAKNAGIRPIMITGDHALTAEAIACDLGIIERGTRAITGAELEKMDEAGLQAALKRTSAFARVSPEHKLRLVKALQNQGEIVAMTGDGVNDAPALKQADIGVAMGITGTEVSKGAADMVLLDDNFATIVAAVEEGRTIYDNIRKFVRYLLSSNIGEIIVMFIAIVIGMPLPLLATQILWVNLVTDGLPAIALGFEASEKGVMRRKPRPKGESIFAHGLARQIVFLAVVLGLTTLAGFYYGHVAHGLDPFSPTLGLERQSSAELARFVERDAIPADWDTLSTEQRIALLTEVHGSGAHAENEILAQAERIPRTIAFTVLAFGQMFHVAGIHAGDRESFFRGWFKKNPWLFWAILSTFVLQLMVIYLPFFQAVFETYPIGLSELLVSTALASLMLIATEIDKLLIRWLKLPSPSVDEG